MKKESSRPLTDKQSADLETLVALPDDQIDLSEIPDVRDCSGPRWGLFYRPLKQQLTLRLDADVVAWFKKRAPDGRGYQTDINRALREHVLQRHNFTGQSPRTD